MQELGDAVKLSQQGKSSQLNELLENAAEHVGTTPENFNEMISTIFQ